MNEVGCPSRAVIGAESRRRGKRFSKIRERIMAAAVLRPLTA